MDSTELFQSALDYEEKIRDLYRNAERVVDDERGKAIFRSLGNDEQSHIDFLRYSLEQLKKQGAIDLAKLQSPIPDPKAIKDSVAKLTAKIPERMLGDVKKVLNSALQMEKETSAFYRKAMGESQGPVRKVFERFLEIEDRHVDVVQFELDHAASSGLWFNFLEVDLEAE